MAEPAPFNASFAPVRCANGLACFPRDLESAKAVLGPESGYPTDGAYRDFYHDVGYELPESDLEGFMPA
jgi:1,4-alpha-glucan branching enzyme